MRNPWIMMMAAVAIGFITSSARAQCWRYDTTCCKACDLHFLPCSDCGVGFFCCPGIMLNETIPTRTEPDYATGYKVVGTTITTVQALCMGQWYTHNATCTACERSGVYFSFAHTIDLAPAYNCPPAI